MLEKKKIEDIEMYEHVITADDVEYITDVTLDDDLDISWKSTMKMIELHRES